MELRQLEYFVAVAEEANFTRAAERVHISQSGVSAQVRALESTLGAELFDRSGRSARLTTAGAAALPHARRALAAAAALRQAVDEVNGLVRGHLTAGMITGCEVTPWFAALAAFHREHPGIEIKLREDTSDRLVAGVLAGEIDIALVGTAGEPPSGVGAEIIISEGLAALVPPGHPLASDTTEPGDTDGSHRDHSTHHPNTRDADTTTTTDAGTRAISLHDLAAYPLVSLPPGTGIRNVLDQACAAAGLRPTIVLEASAPGAVVDLGARGMGVAVLSRSMATAYPEMRAIPIEGVTIPAVLALIWRPKPTPAVRELLPHCREAFGTEPRDQRAAG